MKGSRFGCIIVAVFIAGLTAAGSTAAAHAGATSTYYAGWAVEAYPELGSSEMQSMLQRMADNGANVIWIGHNNPGEADPAKVEPGLSYAVYEAYLDPADPRHETATEIVQSQHRMLEAARAVGLKAVLPVGYQIQMGREWNQAHPDDVRRDTSGQQLDIYGGGVSASFYALSYRQDIKAYYHWVDREFVRPYADVLLMINLADEPLGGDYSSHAEAEFRRRYGVGFDDTWLPPVADSSDQSLHPTTGQELLSRQRLLGEFQSRYIVEYAIYSARLWQEIHPRLPVTMSFDGSQARKTFTMPDVEALFRDTPSNFVLTFDAYPRDGVPRVALSDKNLVGLFLLARSLGVYSARYDKPIWLWASANSWGLSQASPDPGTVSDAVVNGIYLALLVRQAGGDLQGIAYWNYNVKDQGLYNDTHATSYDPEEMFAQVSAGLPTIRRLLSAPADRPDVLILAPPAVSHQQIGATGEAVRLEVQPFHKLAILAKEGINAVVISSLNGWPLDSVRTVIVLAPEADLIPADDLKKLGDYLSRGGKLVTSSKVGETLAKESDAAPELAFGGLVKKRGNLYIAQKGIAVLFEDARHEILSDFWAEALGLKNPQPGYRVVTQQAALHYQIDRESIEVRTDLPFRAMGYLYDDQARPIEWQIGTSLKVPLRRREFVLLWRVPRTVLRMD